MSDKSTELSSVSSQLMRFIAEIPIGDPIEIAGVVNYLLNLPKEEKEQFIVLFSSLAFQRSAQEEYQADQIIVPAHRRRKRKKEAEKKEDKRQDLSSSESVPKNNGVRDYWKVLSSVVDSGHVVANESSSKDAEIIEENTKPVKRMRRSKKIREKSLREPKE